MAAPFVIPIGSVYFLVVQQGYAATTPAIVFAGMLSFLLSGITCLVCEARK